MLRLANLRGQVYAGDSFGEGWVMGEQERTYSAVAEEPTVLLTVSRTAYFAVEQVPSSLPTSAPCGARIRALSAAACSALSAHS